MFVVNREVCQGCGDCLEDCPAGAISLVEGLAAINQELCTACGVCSTLCPQGAIMEVLEPEPEARPLSPSAALAEQAVARSSLPLAVREPASPPAPLTNRMLATAGVALAFLGREVVPRLAVALVDAVERRLSQDATATRSSAGPGGRKSRQRRRGRGRGR
jgi:Fe-S-cluster-containing hydrogenase component 2